MTSNKDMPAMPSGVLQGAYNAGQEPLNAGLTKLEHFAGLAMQGAWLQLTDGNRPQHYQHAAESCVAMAKALLAQLEEKDCE